MQLAPSWRREVRVNAIAPAVVKTRFAAALYEADEAKVAAGYPLGRLGEPEDIGAAVAFLASGDAAWITGQTLVVDGGVGLDVRMQGPAGSCSYCRLRSASQIRHPRFRRSPGRSAGRCARARAGCGGGPGNSSNR